MISKEEAEFFILNKLLNDRYIGHKQTVESNIPKGAPPGADWKTIRKAYHKLVSRGFLFVKPKHYDNHVSIRPNRLDEIRAYMEELRKIINSQQNRQTTS